MIKILGWCAGGIAVVAVMLAVYRLISRVDKENVATVDRIVRTLVARLLANRLEYRESQLLELLSTKHAGSDNGLRERVEESVRRVDLTFQRKSDRSTIRIEAGLVFRDGDYASASTECSWDTLPQSVRAEFLTTGESTLNRSWSLPWRMAGQVE